MNREFEYIRHITTKLFEYSHADIEESNQLIAKFQSAIIDPSFREECISFIPKYISDLVKVNQLDVSILDRALGVRSSLRKIACDDVILSMARDPMIVSYIEDNQLKSKNFICSNIFNNNLLYKLKNKLEIGEVLNLNNYCCLDLIDCLYAGGIKAEIIMDAIFPKENNLLKIIKSLAFASEAYYHLLFEHNETEFNDLFCKVAVKYASLGLYEPIVNYVYDESIYNSCVFMKNNHADSQKSSFLNMISGFSNAVILNDAKNHSLRTDPVSISNYVYHLNVLTQYFSNDDICENLTTSVNSKQLTELIVNCLRVDKFDLALNFYQKGLEINVLVNNETIENYDPSALDDFNSIIITSTLDHIIGDINAVEYSDSINQVLDNEKMDLSL